MQSPPEDRGANKGITSNEAGVEWIEIPDVHPSVCAKVSRYSGASGVSEWHVAIFLKSDAPDPLATLENAWLKTLEAIGLSPNDTLLRRVFSSDEHDQQIGLERFAKSYPGAFSSIGQRPLTGGSLAIWSYHLSDPNESLETTGGGARFSCMRGALQHHWFSGLHDTSSQEAGSQTAQVLEEHDRELEAHGMTLAGHVVRTWWFVRDIDADYQALVHVRSSFFEKHGLNENTHYIASTGIAGGHPHPSALVSLDSYAVGGLAAEQIEYLSAPNHLGPTHDYGVTFERATAISYADRRHVFISGTASIDTAGNIVHPGDVLHQLDRTMENIGALLTGAEASFTDLAVILVYLRNPADGSSVESVLRKRLPHLPMIFLHAPVCRPGWLVEIEGIAMVDAQSPSLPEF